MKWYKYHSGIGGKEMKTVEDLKQYDEQFLIELLSIHAIHRQLNYDRETIRNVIVNLTP